MPVEMKPSSRYSRFSGEMGFSLEVRSRSRSKETSIAESPKILSPHPNQLLKCREKAKLGSPSGLPYSNLDCGHGLSPKATDGLKLESRSKVSSEKSWIGIKGNKNELVKHMSDLPGYLQRFEEGESTQKALNFGVLDWGSLEKWKHKKCISPGSTSVASSSSAKSLFKANGTKSLPPRRVQPQSVTQHSSVDSFHECLSKDVKKSQWEVLQKEPETPKTNSSDRLQNSHWVDSLDERYNPEKSERKVSDQKVRATRETPLSGLRKHQLSHACKTQTSDQSVVTPTLEELQAPELGQRHRTRDHRRIIRTEDTPRRDSPQKFQTSNPRMLFDEKFRQVDSEISPDGSSQAAHSAGLNPEVAPSCHSAAGLEANSVSDKKKYSLIHGRGTGLSDDSPCTSHSSNGSPTIVSHNKCTDANSACVKLPGENRLMERMDNGNAEPAAVKRGLFSPSRRFSFSLEKISTSFKESSGVEQLSSASDCVEPDIFSDCLSSDGHLSEESIAGTIHSCDFHVGVETNTSFDLSAQSMDFSSNNVCTFSCPIEKPSTPRSESAIRVRKSLGVEANEQVALHGRHPSPNHRFSFSLGRLSRSFSFKEGLAVPKMNATSVCTKSGPVTLEVSGSLDNENRNKATSHGRARSSPLRRMLDPLLKARVTTPSVDDANSLTEKLNFTSEGNTKSHQHKNKEAPIQALLQIRVKNGVPLFELVVKNNRDILVAMKKPGKDDADWTYTLYSVSAIKKKSGIWINHGKKGRSRALDYTIVGQMKIFKPLHPDLMEESSGDQFTLRESVLYGFDGIRADHETPAFMPEMEGAAIIVKIPICDSSDDRDQKIKNKEFLFRDFFQEDVLHSLEIEKFNSTTVILPGGVHCSPNGELPSPLIERWKSGGSCDCGGWDLGCKLRVLTNDDQICNFHTPPPSFSSPNGFHLYCQGGAGDSRPIFSLTPFKKGIYSVEFQKPVSLVQAFSICVAVISSHQSFDFAEENEATTLASGCDGMRVPAKFHGELPPPSPVGRV